MTAKCNLGILASHTGTNLQSIMDACDAGLINGAVRVVISNNSKSKALVRASAAGIPTAHVSSKTHSDPAELDRAILALLRENRVSLVVLAGYMKMIGPEVLKEYRNRIINIHPALLPKFGGKGMYGINVHRAVIEAGDTVSGASVHVVDGSYDHGPVIARRKVQVLPGDDADTLSARILSHEHRLMTETLGKIALGEIELLGDPLPCVIRPVDLSPVQGIWDREDPDLLGSLEVIRKSFSTVAARLQLSRDNCPSHPSFVEAGALQALRDKGAEFFGLFAGSPSSGKADGESGAKTAGGDAPMAAAGVQDLHQVRQVGFAAVEPAPGDGGLFYVEKVSVLPQARHQGYGTLLMRHAFRLIRLRGGRRVSVALIDEQQVLKEWYRGMGFSVSGTRRFEHLPFTVCFMERQLGDDGEEISP